MARPVVIIPIWFVYFLLLSVNIKEHMSTERVMGLDTLDGEREEDTINDAQERWASGKLLWEGTRTGQRAQRMWWRENSDAHLQVLPSQALRWAVSEPESLAEPGAGDGKTDEARQNWGTGRTLFYKVLVDCAELSLKGLMPVICWTIGVSYYWPCKHWQACPLECWQNGGGQTGGSVLEVQSTYVEWKNDHCHSCSSGLAIWKAICIFVCKWSCLEFWSLPGNCPVRLKERAGFYLEACVPGTCFKGRINLSKTLWAEISGEECMLTAERSQESVRFQKQILFCDSHWSWLLHTLDYFCVSWSHQELENFRWCQKIPWGLKMKIQARKAEELMETM